MSAKSGYAKDVRPDRVEADEANGLAIPVASERGGQEGRVPPAKKVYRPGTHKVVDVTEAAANLQKRSSGELPPIEGGLDGPGMSADDLPPEVAEAMRMPSPDFDPLSAAPEVEMLPAPEPPYVAAAAIAPPRPEVYTAVEAPKTREQEYLEQRIRISLDLSEGTMSLPAISVTHCRYGLTILLPLADDGVTFIPKPGSELVVSRGSESWRCFFPGVHFEIEELGVIGLMCVGAEDE